MSEFSEFLREQFAELGVVRVRRMFGGAGLFCDGVMFGLVFEDALYLKVDDRSRAEFEAQELEPFVYERQGKPVSLSFLRAPEEILDDADSALYWGRLALDAAWRGRKA